MLQVNKYKHIQRVIPILLIENGSLYKTVKFRRPNYIGDPINAVKILNDKEVDELLIVDISATRKKRIDFKLLETMAKQAFMPLTYVGGIDSISAVERITKSGIEKVGLNNMLFENPTGVRNIVDEFGASTIVASVDITKDLFGNYKLYRYNKSNFSKESLEYLKRIEELGVGEIFIQDVRREGTQIGPDNKLLSEIASRVSIPIVFSGGIGKYNDIREVLSHNISGVGAGSLFVYQGIHNAVLINYDRKRFEKE